MRCAACGRENADTHRFCIHCGAPLEATQPAPGAEPEDPVEALHADVRRLTVEVAELRRAMAEHGLTARREAGRARAVPPRRPLADPAPEASQPGEQIAAPEAQRWGAIDWELILGGNWLARVGVLALIIGTAFFLKLAFDNDWIGETERVLLGIVGGLALVGAGEYWRRRYPIYSQALVGGGVAILYLSVFAAFAFYDLIATYPAIGVLAFISVSAAALALRYESTSLAILGIVGAYFAPFLIGALDETTGQGAGGSGTSYEVVVYTLLVNVGVVALSTFRNWRWFTLLALVASLASFMAWYDYAEPSVELAVSQAFLTGIFLTFVAATTLYHVIWRRVPQALDHSLMVLNAGAYLALSYGTLWDDYREWMGLLALGLAVFYAVLGAFVMRRGREQYYLALMALGIAAVMLAIVAPVQLGGPWFGAAWAVQGVVLVGLSFRLGRIHTRLAGLLALSLGALTLLLYGVPMALTEDLTPFANAYALSFAMAAAAFYAVSYLLWRGRETLHEKEWAEFPAVLTTANVLLAALFATQLGSTWLPVAWSALAVVMVLAWRFLDLREMRWSGCVLLAVLAARLVGWETTIETDGFTPVLNGRMLAFASGIAALYAAVAMLRGRPDRVSERERVLLVPALLTGASALTLWILAAEAFALVDSGIIDVSGDAEFYVKSLSLSLVLAVYASAALAIGVLRRLRTVRIASLGLLAVPVVKLFLADSFALEQGYRVAAFMCLGALLLAGGFLYQRYQEAIRGFLFEQGEAETDDK